jgi:tRNA modification GTPase
MSLSFDDTIAAISSAVGPAARMVVRISGPESSSLAERLGASNAGSGVVRATLALAGLSFPAWVYRFIAPRSYTGQDLLELHLPGNVLLARMVLDWLLAQGVRSAEPGEFTARAYFNGKLDLAQAEGVAAAIAAQSGQHLAAARQLMAGELSRRLEPIMAALADALALVEADIDFSEEDIQLLSRAEIGRRMAAILRQLQALLADSARFEKLSHEPTIVLAGRPNAGKTTLANALAGQARGLVSPRAGTTRDALSVEVVLHRGIVRLIDIAGLEDEAHQHEIPRQMQQRARRAIAEADVLVLLREASDARPAFALPRQPQLTVISKIDLPGAIAPPEGHLGVSAITGAGMEALRNALDNLAFGSDLPGAALALTARHLQAIDEAAAALRRGLNEPAAAPEILAAELRCALDALGQILGIVTPDDILGKIFATFCIGK